MNVLYCNHSYSRVWTTGGIKVDDRGEGVFEMQITPKVIAPKKFREKSEKNKKKPPKNQKPPKKPKKTS